MKKFIIVILVLLLLAGMVGGTYALTNGFKEWNPKQWGQKTPTVDTPTVPDVPTKPDEPPVQKAQVAKAVLHNDYKEADAGDFESFSGRSFTVKLEDKDGKVLDNNDYDIDVSFQFVHSAPLLNELLGKMSQSVPLYNVGLKYYLKSNVFDVVKLYTPLVFFEDEKFCIDLYQENLAKLMLLSDFDAAITYINTQLETVSNVVINIVVDGKLFTFEDSFYRKPIFGSIL